MARVGEKRNICKVLVGKPEGNRPVVGTQGRRDGATSEGYANVNVPGQSNMCTDTSVH